MTTKETKHWMNEGRTDSRLGMAPRFAYGHVSGIALDAATCEVAKDQDTAAAYIAGYRAHVRERSVAR